MLRPVIVVCIVIRAIDAFRTFDIVWTLTGGGPAARPSCSASTPTCWPSSISTSAAARRRRSSAASSSWWSAWCSTASSTACQEPDAMAMVRTPLLFGRLPPGGRRALFALALSGICLALRLSRAVADPDLAAAGIGRLLRPSRHRVHPGELRRGAERRAAGPGLRQLGADLDPGHRLLAAGDGVERLHAVALPAGLPPAPGSAPSTCSAACPTSPGCCRSTS